jgi:hypothetical protein
MSARINGALKRETATAHREAGHAVMACRLGVPFRYATIIPGLGSLGHVRFGRISKYCNWESEAYRADRARFWYERSIQIDFAGQIAEKLYLGRRPNRYTHMSDDQGAVDLAIHVCGDGQTATAWLNSLFLCALKSVERERKAVQAVADELLERKRLSRVEVIAAIDRSFGLKPMSFPPVKAVAK